MITYITPDYIRGGNENHNKWLAEKYKEDKHFFDNTFKIFLAGTIDNGEEDDWQYGLFLKLAVFVGASSFDPDGRRHLEDIPNFTVFSPRRKDWPENATTEMVEEQIRWEQEKLDEADLIIMVLQDGSKSPISLLELGLYGPEGKLICFCTPRFYRYSNVKLTCEKWHIPLRQELNSAEIAAQIMEIYKEWEKC